MNARHKLNCAHLYGAIVIAAIVGLIADSWVAFVVTFAICVALGVAAGDIRPSGRR